MAFAEMYAALHPRLVAWSAAAFGAADAEDLAQETMARALASYDRLDASADPWPWLVTIARNLAHDRHRTARRAAAAIVEEPSPPADPHEAAVVAERRRTTLRALARLPERERTLLLLRDYHELGIAEIARLDGREPGALRQHLFRARRRFAKEFTALGGRALGLAPAVSRRWWSLRRRVTPWLDAVGPALPGAAVAFAVVAAAPAATATARTTRPTGVAVARTNDRLAHPAGFRPGTPEAPGGHVATPARYAPAGRRESAAAAPAVAVDVDGVPGVTPSRHTDRAHVPVAGKDVYVEGNGWSSEQHEAVCSLPLVDCGR